MKVGIVVFPGSNCDEDTFHVVGPVLGHQPQMLWHKDRDLKGSELVILPGGFAHGDYLRCGAIARFSAVMEEVAAFAKKGGPAGVCCACAPTARRPLPRSASGWCSAAS